MDSSVIFTIAVVAIIIVGKLINRIAETSGNDTSDTTQEFDAAHEFNGEGAIPQPSRVPQKEEIDNLAEKIYAQILAEKRRIEAAGIPQPKPIYTAGRAPQFHSTSTVAPTPNKRAQKAKQPKKAQIKPQIKEAEIKAIAAIDEPKSEIINDFDLRKAVIYSEILKPKFDE